MKTPSTTVASGRGFFILEDLAGFHKPARSHPFHSLKILFTKNPSAVSTLKK